MEPKETRPPLQTQSLLEQLDAGMSYLLTLVIGPTRSGKSALLSEWVAARGWPVAWVALEVEDNEPGHFLRHLVAASQALEPEIARAGLPRPEPGAPWAMQDGLAAWLNALAALEGEFCLILDGYERIQAPAVRDLVARMLDYPPPHLHVCLASQVEPPLPLARLRVRRQLLEVRLGG
jgi:LuxR family maltose regulon positive regulatory protein